MSDRLAPREINPTWHIPQCPDSDRRRVRGVGRPGPLRKRLVWECRGLVLSEEWQPLLPKPSIERPKERIPDAVRHVCD